MSELKPHKWCDVIVAWAGGAKVEQKWRFGQTWEIVEDGRTPAFNHADYDIRIYDKHREVAEAMARGELCQWRFIGGWNDALAPLSSYDGCWDGRDWRIAPKPDPYQRLRDAIRAGKKIEFYSNKVGLGSWVSIGTEDDHIPDRTFHLPPDQYRIVTKPDYVVSGPVYYEVSAERRWSPVNVTIDGETNIAKSVELIK